MTPECQRIYMNVAEAMSEKSKDPSTKVGAVLVHHDMKLCSIGFNGFPQRMFDNPDFLNDPALRHKKLQRTVHAEVNAIRFSSEKNTDGFHLVVTRHPCDRCALEIACTGITDVWYRENLDYEERWGESIRGAHDIFDECGILVHRVD